MLSIATMGPVGSDSFQAAKQFNPEADLACFNSLHELISAFEAGQNDYAIIPFYNTREGIIEEYFRKLVDLDGYHWVDNIVLPINLSMGVFKKSVSKIDTILGRGSIFNQCKDYLKANFPEATLVTVRNIEKQMSAVQHLEPDEYGVIESEELLKKFGLYLFDREVVSHNKTRFAVIAKKPAERSGYDATTIITRPLRDRVGMLVDILGEFTRRGINILDLRSENDIETQKLQIYLELEGHPSEKSVSDALISVEKNVIQEKNSLKILGSFPRVDMRVKRIKKFGFIGTGDMSLWFADRLNHEGYSTVMTGRSTKLRPEEMIPEVDVVMICVPISATSSTIKHYGKFLKPGQALIILAGESENTLQTAIENTDEGVEILFVHNLWGPQALTMKDKNAVIVRTNRSGVFCSEFEAFLYKHGAELYKDSAKQHDLYMGVSQKLPTIISVALASTLKKHSIDCDDIGNHSTLTSIYGVLAMARVHSQNPRTYAEIMSTKGDGQSIVSTFLEEVKKISLLAEKQEIQKLCEIMEANSSYLTPSFLQARMSQAKAVDEVLNESGIAVQF